ncbi:uncharacterized protein (TIGR02599 family) [Roseimicrobium gellanilyticum]|uniref:Uncharacterized protein (TIGR02599 family) n=1 Tax=Roseimicrobium gellanilyticum TaxID=748857 RepID=A0A366HN58_9BACT|nr:Verru_Chthon cassette protein C [Roseimicrobium gellanilyticum]RBP43876.1 uncharacterized protein (TIGR02599 family) [Roseimicrobium gellanilyticum]
MDSSSKQRRNRYGFTIVELLVAISILALMVTLLADVLVRTQDTVSKANTQVTEFQEARAALDSMSYSLSQASLDAYWAFKRDANGNATSYERSSDHHFILAASKDLVGTKGEEHGQAVFFQAPLGHAGSLGGAAGNGGATSQYERLHDLMNCWGYYVKYDSDLAERPNFMQQNTNVNPERKRFRLMQYAQPAEKSILYSTTLKINTQKARADAIKWFQDDLTEHSRPVAENVLAVVLVPFSANVTVTNAGSGYSDTKIEPDSKYGYDSRDLQWNGVNTISRSRQHQLPPMVGITLIVADEKEYDRFVNLNGGDADAAAEKVRGVLKGKFTDFAKNADDLKAVEAGLGGLKLHYKLLTTTVSLRASKWITELQ